MATIGSQREPGRLDRVLHRGVIALTRAGVSVWGTRMLYVRGRASGEWRATPVNLLRLGNDRYLVAPRGQTQWVRNLRKAGGGQIRLGRRVERFTATELLDQEKPAVLRAYLKRWGFEVRGHIGGLHADATDEQLRRIAPGCPAFRITQDQRVGPRNHGLSPS